MRLQTLLAAFGSLVLLGGCETVAQRNQLIGGALVTAAAITPGTDLEQVYYLGSFDPRGQIPPQLYRIRVRGQASMLNATRFASGWVPAEVIDSLGTTLSIGGSGVGFNGPANAASAPAGAASAAPFSANQDRQLVQFGPEGFRTAPTRHRLVILMGSDPSQVEQAFASALGTVAQAKSGQSAQVLDQDLIELLLKLAHERAALEQLKKEL